MKIATMTWYHYENYGTALQAIALTDVLRRLGHDVQMVNYRPTGRVLSTIDYSLTAYLSRHLGRKKTTSNNLPPYTSEEKTARFQSFLEEHLILTERCKNTSDLEGLSDQFDAFVCGSDQIWSPLVFDPKYYLDFVHESHKKIAYAPSLGVKQWNDKFIKEEIKELLSSFAALSVREEAGRQLIKKLTGRNSDVVLDPTLLLTGAEWKELCGLSQRDSAPYLLVYFLGNHAAHWESAKKTANKLGLQLRIIPVYKDDIQKEGCIQDAVGPREFLEQINGASYVCTDSYHGLNFSILFHRPFTCYMRFEDNDTKNQNSRVEHLLEMVGMQNRIYRSNNESKIISELFQIDRAHEVLADRRRSSLQYLEKALKEPLISKQDRRHVIQQNALCCGCGACSVTCPTKAISISINQNGFWSATVNENSCIHCGKCLLVCPFCGKTYEKDAEQSKLYSFINKDINVLQKSTSGGAAYTIAAALLNKAYTIIGCSYNRKKQVAEHILVHNSEDLSKIQGSKYIPSEFSAALMEAAKIHSPIVFFGTPCQIAGARRLFGTRDNVIYCDLVCHGVPSMLLFRKYLGFIHRKSGINTANMEMIFRYKPRSWRTIHLFATDGNKEYCKNQFEDPFFRAFERGICYNEACYECRWRGNSEADIRLADYWGPRFEDNQSGVSMVICFTEKGQKMVEYLQQSNMELLEQPIADYLMYQAQCNPLKPAFYKSVMHHLQTNTKIETLDERFVFPMENYHLPRSKRMLHFLRMLFFKD